MFDLQENINLEQLSELLNKTLPTNKSILALLTKGILLLQKNKYMHMDIKGANILRSEENIIGYNSKFSIAGMRNTKKS